MNLANFEQFTAINVLSDPGHIKGKVVIPNVMQVSMRWTLEDGRIGHCVLHARYPSTYPGSVALANAFQTGWFAGAAWTALAAFLASTNAAAAVDLRDLGVPDQPIISSSGGSSPGTSASPSLPNEVAAVISLKTNLVGPANRGRLYIPGWATNALGAGDVIAAAAVTALNTWASSLNNPFATANLSWVIAQPARQAYTGSSGTQHDARDPGSIAVQQAIVKDNHWDSQRRRGLK